MTTTKNCFFSVIIKHFYLVGGIDFWWGGNKNLVGAHFPGEGRGGGDEWIFGWWGGLPPFPSAGKTLFYVKKKNKKNSEWEEESIILILALVLSSFLSVKSFLKIGANQFSLLIFRSFKLSLPLFLTIQGKR